MRVIREWRQKPEGGREMRPHFIVKATLVACLVLVGVMLAAPAASGQGNKGGGGGGGGHTEAAVNNLSYPALMIGGQGSAAVALSATSHVLGTTFSYGCDKPEMVGTFSYPNTTCRNEAGVFIDADACTAEGAACFGYEVDRIYWQKVSTNYWKAETTGTVTVPPLPPPPPVTVDYLDWADNLESKSWTATSIIRVETTPFEAHTEGTKRGYQMWHVSGQGTDEQWGVRAHETDGQLDAVYAYDSPYAIINTGNARLHIAKLLPAATPCPTTNQSSPYSGDWVSNNWVGTCRLKDIGFTAELNVGGKYVYGYNWAVRRDALPTTCEGGPWNLAGWWRLTFYAPATEILFDNPGIPTAPPPPVLPSPFVATSLDAVLAAAATEEGDTGPLYKPVIDKLNNLTYIDICVTGGSGGGGKK
jgi:hypothetical protein